MRQPLRRAMASYGVFVAACGFEYDGPKGHIGFAPRISAENFRAAFTGSEGWGSYSQVIDGGKMEAKISIRRGALRLKSASLALPKGAKAARAMVRLDQSEVAATVKCSDNQTTLTFADDSHLVRGQDLHITAG